MKPIIEVEDLTMAYGDKAVLLDVDVNLYEGTRTAIVGPNGAGKSTLLKGILGLIKPLSGDVRIMGKEYKEIQKEVAYIPQSGSVNWNFPTTVFDVVLMGRYVHLGLFKRPGDEDKKKAYEAIQEMGLTEVQDHQISQLSGGQKQRVFFARAICQDASLYLMDEPLAGVDIKTEKVIIKKLMEFQNQGRTSIVVHHDLHTVEEYFDHALLLNRRVISQGPVKEALSDKYLEIAYREV